jgi:hypothetical protein
MDPFTIAMMGGTALASILGGKEASRTNQLNADISLLNYYAQQKAQRDAWAEAQRQQAEQKLGTTDAQGNRTRFIPGVGWVTELSDKQQQLSDLTEAEQLRQLTDEAGRESENSKRARDRRGREDILASAAEDEMRLARRPSVGGLRQLLLARGAAERNRQADRAGNASARQNIRAGGRNAAGLVQGARAEADADSARQAGIDAQLAATGMADSMFAQKRDAGRNLYDYFRRASTTGAMPVNGVSPTGPSTRGTGSVDQQFLNLLQGGAPQLDYQSPDNAMLGTAQGLIDMFGAYQTNQQAKKQAGRTRSNMGSWQGIVK